MRNQGKLGGGGETQLAPAPQLQDAASQETCQRWKGATVQSRKAERFTAR